MPLAKVIVSVSTVMEATQLVTSDMYAARNDEKETRKAADRKNIRRYRLPYFRYQIHCEYNSFHYRALEGRETSR